MTTHVDHVQIRQEVTEYYQYAMFSHKWEENEPLFKEVINKGVYQLEESFTNEKLKMFCKVMRDAGLNWAWSDTCCINREDPTVLQEAMVSMFKWYEGSALTAVYLRDVPSRRLVDSIWNGRAWTLQEYHASKVVRFYNNDWTLYKNLDIPNHKDSLEILSEMEEVTGISASALTALQPGLENIREKFRLASTRQSTRVEDTAYSLFGIFSLSLSVVYGEGDQALGRLLAQLLTSSGDTSILAWTGRSGRFNSCFPGQIFVFNRSSTSHVPLVPTRAEMESTITRSRSSALNLDSVTKLYDRLNELPVPSFSGKRMKLPCLTFKLGQLSTSRSRAAQVFRAQTTVLGIVEIKTDTDLSRLSPLYLIHPWIDFLLDRQPVGSTFLARSWESSDSQSSPVSDLPSLPQTVLENTDDQSTIGAPLSSGVSNVSLAVVPRKRGASFASRFGLPFGGRNLARPQDTVSLRPPSTLTERDKQVLALQVITRLRQPFGALLLTSDPGNVAAYRRVAAESLITVQVEEITPTMLDKLIDNVRVLDVL